MFFKASPYTPSSMLCKSVQTLQKNIGVHLGEHTAKGIWSLQECKLHINYLKPKAVFLALKEFQYLGLSQVATEKYHSGCLHKQGRSHEVRRFVYPSLENPGLVLQETGDSQGPTYRLAESDSRQSIQTRPDHLDRVISPFRGIPVDMQQVAPASSRSMYNKV